MNKIMEQLDVDIRTNILAGSPGVVAALKVIKGELQRQPKKDLSEEESIKILRKLERNEIETMRLKGIVKSLFLDVVKTFLPSEVSEGDILKWILLNINFAELKNKYQAIGIVKKNFPGVDGKVVKDIINKI